MITLTYNGLEMIVSRMHPWKRVKMVDQRGNYLFTRHTIHCECIYNPDINSFADRGVNQKGIRGARTDRSIRHQLLQPRKPLILLIDRVVALAVTANANGLALDMTHGPQPLEVNVTSLAGLKTWFVDIVLQVDVNDSADDANKVIISHVFSVESELDFRLLETRTTTGTVQFRSDVLRQFDVAGNLIGQNQDFPDNYRAWFVPRTPKGFYRHSLKVTPDPDGVRVHYQCVDVMMPSAWKAPFRKIEVGISEKEMLPSWEGVLLGAGSSVINLAREAAGVAVDPDSLGRQKAVSLGGNVLAGGFEILKGVLPSTAIGVVVKAWGEVWNDAITHRELILGASKIVLAVQTWVHKAFPAGNLNKRGLSVESNLLIDPVGNFVQLERSWVKPTAGLPLSRGGVIDGNVLLPDPASGLFVDGGFPTEADLLKSGGSDVIQFRPRLQDAQTGAGEDKVRSPSGLIAYSGSYHDFGELPAQSGGAPAVRPQKP